MINVSKYLVMLWVGLLPIWAHAASYDVEGEGKEELIKRVVTIAQAKERLRSSFRQMDRCPSGSCQNGTSTHICEVIGALDSNIDGAIIDGALASHAASKWADRKDIRMMQLIYRQCKPTNYQYWAYERVLHVAYQPEKLADAKIRRYLGVGPPPEQ
ncbi:MAG: hypothetical protein PHH47_10955 [Gallionella sp.]|nr:hypothetical protein [Gallionella sp.]MDD4946536.1 hypothetical protein [Gallionella sp.]MDD5612869.1 hypothetical protein [Gallionella sp.]